MTLLSGRVALVTGAASGIGLAIAERFAEQGARVVVADVRADEAQRAAAAARERGLTVEAGTVDVADEASVAAAFAACAETFDVPDVVVANAGILHLAPTVEHDAAAFRRVMEVNLVGTFLTLREAARLLVERDRGGSLIATGSIAALRGLPSNASYAASKFGIVGLVETMAAELAGRGIRVNAVSPGQIDTVMLRDVVATRSAERGLSEADALGQLMARVPMGRPGSVGEVADAFTWLASPMSSYTTGQNLVVDGGWRVS